MKGLLKRAAAALLTAACLMSLSACSAEDNAAEAPKISTEGVAADAYTEQMVLQQAVSILIANEESLLIDPVLADDYYNNTLETYSRETLPWVVKITVKQPLNGWWGRNITEHLTQPDKGYQIDQNPVAGGDTGQRGGYAPQHDLQHTQRIVRLSSGGTDRSEQGAVQENDRRLRVRTGTVKTRNRSDGRMAGNTGNHECGCGCLCRPDPEVCGCAGIDTYDSQ